MIKVDSQNDLDNLIVSPNWEDSFVREWYLLSPSYVHLDEQVIISPDAAPNMRILICMPETKCPGIELFFHEVEDIYFSFRTNLNPSGKFHVDHIIFAFDENENSAIHCKAMYYRILKKDCWGWNLKYGLENVFDPNGFLLLENL